MVRQLPQSFSPSKLLVRLPNWLGDAVMATGLLQQIKALWPASTIDLIGPPWIVSLFEEDPLIRNVWGWQVKGFEKFSPFHPFFSQIRKEAYDMGLLLTNSFSSAWQMFFMGVKVRVGFSSDARHWLLTHACPFPRERNTQHLVVTYQALLKQVSAQARELPTYSPSIEISEKEKVQARKWLKKHLLSSCAKIIGLNPSAAYGPAKQWPKERFQSLARLLVARGLAVLIFGDNSSKELGDYVAQGLESTGLCYNLSGQTSLKTFIALMAVCDGVVANDSGPMHLAAAMKVPLVAIFGSTDDKLTGPYGWGHVIHKHVACSPCFKRVCPIDFRCMMRLEVDEVEKALFQELGANR